MWTVGLTVEIKATFWCRISLDGRPNRRNKDASSNFFGVARMAP